MTRQNTSKKNFGGHRRFRGDVPRSPAGAPHDGRLGARKGNRLLLPRVRGVRFPHSSAVLFPLRGVHVKVRGGGHFGGGGHRGFHGVRTAARAVFTWFDGGRLLVGTGRKRPFENDRRALGVRVHFEFSQVETVLKSQNRRSPRRNRKFGKENHRHREPVRSQRDPEIEMSQNIQDRILPDIPRPGRIPPKARFVLPSESESPRIHDGRSVPRGRAMIGRSKKGHAGKGVPGISRSGGPMNGMIPLFMKKGPLRRVLRRRGRRTEEIRAFPGAPIEKHVGPREAAGHEREPR